MHARGKTFEPSDKSLIPPLSLAYKKRVYSPARIRFPMKRVDFDPHGAPGSEGPGGRNIQQPGRQQVRAHQLGRGARHRHQRDAAYEREVRADGHPLPVGPARREQGRSRPARVRAQAAASFRRLHPAGPQPRQLGGLVVGGQARMGLRAGGAADAAEEPAVGHLSERRAPLVLGVRPGDDHLGLGRPTPQPVQLLVDRTRHQADLHRPGLQLRQRRARRQVDPRPPEHRRRALPRHLPPVVQERDVRQGVPRYPRVRRRQVRGLRHGPGGRTGEEPGVGGAHHRGAFADHQGAGR